MKSSVESSTSNYRFHPSLRSFSQYSAVVKVRFSDEGTYWPMKYGEESEGINHRTIDFRGVDYDSKTLGINCIQITKDWLRFQGSTAVELVFVGWLMVQIPLKNAL